MAKKQSMGMDLTQGSVFKQLLIFSFPFMLSNGLQMLYSLVDLMVVGQVVGSYGLSAINISSQISMLMTTVCMGFSTGAQVYISQLVGAGKQEDLNRTIGTTFSIVTLLSLVMSVIGIVGGRWFLQLLSTPEESFQMALDYHIICSAGMIFIYGYNMVSAVLRGMGDSKTPLVFVLIASVINIILDIWFVAGLGWQAKGAAWATVIGQAFSFLVSLVYLYVRRSAFHFDFKPRSFRMHGDVLRILCKLGIPFAIQMSAVNISMLFVNKLVNQVGGVIGSAAFGVSTKVLNIPAILSRSISMAATGMVGQNMGAGKPERAQKAINMGMLLSLGVWGVYGVWYLISPESIFRIFTGEEAVMAFAGMSAIYSVMSFPAHVLMTCNGFVQGIGDAKFSLIIAILDGVVARVCLSYLFGIVLDMGMAGCFLGYNLATYVTGVPTAIYFYSGVWKKRKMLI